MSSFKRAVLTGLAATFWCSTTAAIAADTCVMQSGPVPNGTYSVGVCIGATSLGCPAVGRLSNAETAAGSSVKNEHSASSTQPCAGEMSGPWVWTPSRACTGRRHRSRRRGRRRWSQLVAAGQQATADHGDDDALGIAVRAARQTPR